MSAQSNEFAGRTTRSNIILISAVLIIFGVLELTFPPSLFQPIVSLLAGMVLLAIFGRKKRVSKHALIALGVLVALFIGINLGWMSQHVTSGQVEADAPWPEIDRILDAEFAGSALIARDGRVYLKKSYAYADRSRLVPNTPATKFMIGSMTKQFTAMGIMILRDQGRLELDDPICEYLPDCPTAWQPIQIHHLLSHTSGIIDVWPVAPVNIPSGTSFIQASGLKIQRITKAFRALNEPATEEIVIEENRSQPLGFLPGERFEYSNTGYVMLGYIIEHVSGKPYGDFLEEAVFGPLQMTSSGYGDQTTGLATGYLNSVLPTVYLNVARAHGAGGLYSTVGDLYKWDQALYGEKLVKKATLEEMFTPRIPIEQMPDFSYAYGWMVGEKYGHPMIQHGGTIGGYYTLITRYPQERITVILLSNDLTVDLGAITDKIDQKLGIE
jgi:CubicO group peptidase (beta-lactamase class C family)